MQIIKFYIRLLCTFGYWRLRINKCKNLNLQISNKLIIIYRISDAGYKKIKPEYINNELCLKNAVQVFPCDLYEWIVIADNCSPTTITMVEKYIPYDKIKKVSIGHGAGTFNLALDLALRFDDETIVYFIENDYLHLTFADKILFEGFALQLADYVTLYDHPDKYGYDSPFVWGGEKTTVFLSKSTHWKFSHSTTMTFAAKVNTLRKDEHIFRRWTTGKHPFDFQIFLNLKKRNRKLISPLPGFSTHGETIFLTPLIEWNKI